MSPATKKEAQAKLALFRPKIGYPDVWRDYSKLDVRAGELRKGCALSIEGGRIAAMNQMIPLGRGGLPEEAAGSVYLFCSPDSDYVSGQCLVVNGGL